MSGSSGIATSPTTRVAPIPRRGSVVLDSISENMVSEAAPSPSKPTVPVVHQFLEGTYSGSWACGRPEGRGTYKSHLGSSFTGIWRRGWADGAGVYNWADGRVDIGRFVGEADRLPLLAAVGEGVRWSRDRSKVSVLRNGIEAEGISQQRAVEIAERLGVSPSVPPSHPPATHGAARVSKRELESLSFLSKRQRVEIDTKIDSAASDEAEGDDDSTAALPFEAIWALLCPKS